MGTPTRTVTTLGAVEDSSDFDPSAVFSELAEIGVGTAILALRRINIERRRLVKELPQIEPVVDAVLDQVESLTAPVSAALGATITSLGDAIEGERGEQLHEAGLFVAAVGPELLRLSGLTKRD